MGKLTYSSQLLRAAALVTSLVGPYALSQSIPTASRTFVPSLFIGIGEASTGLKAGRNIDLSAGLDCAHPLHHLLIGLDVRGDYPVSEGAIVGLKHFELGARVEKPLKHISPYAMFLVGRGELNFQRGGYPLPAQGVRFLQSFTTLYSTGAGFESGQTKHVGLMVDVLIQRWDLPFGQGMTRSGTLYPILGTVGLIYRPW